MKVSFTLIAVLVSFVLGDGRSHGRKGNQAYEGKRYHEADESYRAGLSEVAEPGHARMRFGLLNNLAATRYRLESPDEALRGFIEAAESASGHGERSLARYNAGNAAFKADDLQQALDHYRDALRANPDNLEAKFNYEFVKRRLEQQPQDGQQDPGQDDQDQEQPDPETPDDEQNGESGDSDEDSSSGEDQGEEQAEGEQQEDRDEGQQQPKPQDSPQRLTQEEAERILQALEREEERLLREVQRVQTPPRRVEKDW